MSGLSALQKLQLHEKIEPHLKAISKLFKNPKITLLVRAPDAEDGDLILTADDPDCVIAALKRTWGRP
jgi:hypothetical protein